MTELAILIPVKGRPHRVRPVLESIRAATPEARVVFICDPDDTEEMDAVAEGIQIDSRFQVAETWMVEVAGNYAQKINAAVRATEEPLLLFAADDLEFHPGWLEAAKVKLTDGIGVVGTNDQCNKRAMRGEFATHPLVTREYTKQGTIDEPDKVLHEGYRHEYVDREFSETAQHRGAFAFAPDSIVEHLHPLVGKAPMDDLYSQAWTRMWQGRRLYGRRRHLWGKGDLPRGKHAHV